MPEEPITPHAAPVRDAEGRLTYIGVDGRRYVVGPPPDPEGTGRSRGPRPPDRGDG